MRPVTVHVMCPHCLDVNDDKTLFGGITYFSCDICGKSIKIHNDCEVIGLNIIGGEAGFDSLKELKEDEEKKEDKEDKEKEEEKVKWV